MSDGTFDASKNYKKICYRADRDLLNTELNEAQDIESHERRVLLDKILAPGTIISGLVGVINGGDVSIADGIVYLSGCAVNVPGSVLSFPDSGEYLIYVDVFRRNITASEDLSLVNPLTGEPTAEREKWIATLQTRDTTRDPLPDGAISRTVAPVYIFNRDTGKLTPYVGSTISSGDIFSAFAEHAGHGGLDRHPAATLETAGFMTAGQVEDLSSIKAALPNKADISALNAHKTSGDHDGRYYTESESDGRFAPLSHVGSGGNAHSTATSSQSGFMSASDKTQLGDHESRIVTVESGLAAHKTSADHDSRYYTETESDSRFAPKSHVGSGGNVHSLATNSVAGFMDSSDKIQLGNHESRIITVESALPGKADDADVSAVANALSAHKTSGDHDSRYYTESESDGRFAPIGHVGAVGGAHGLVSEDQAGFMGKEMFSLVRGLIHWYCNYDYGNDGLGTLGCDMFSAPNGMFWRGRCDSNSSHVLVTALRSISSNITAVFEIYHMLGTVAMQTGCLVELIDPANHPSTVPGSKIYYVQLTPESFTNIVIKVSGSGDVGFSMNIFPGNDRQICYDVDPDRLDKPIVC